MTDREYEMQVDRQMQSDYTEYRNEERAKTYEEQLKDKIATLEDENAELREKLEGEEEYSEIATEHFTKKIVELEEENKSIKEQNSLLENKVNRLETELQWYLLEDEKVKLGKLRDAVEHLKIENDQLRKANTKSIVAQIYYQIKEEKRQFEWEKGEILEMYHAMEEDLFEARRTINELTVTTHPIKTEKTV